jgi:hypothetical protein
VSEPAHASTLGDALVATAELMSDDDHERLRWLASVVASTQPELARQIILRWGPPSPNPAERAAEMARRYSASPEGAGT